MHRLTSTSSHGNDELQRVSPFSRLLVPEHRSSSTWMMGCTYTPLTTEFRTLTTGTSRPHHRPTPRQALLTTPIRALVLLATFGPGDFLKNLRTIQISATVWPTCPIKTFLMGTLACLVSYNPLSTSTLMSMQSAVYVTVTAEIDSFTSLDRCLRRRVMVPPPRALHSRSYPRRHSHLTTLR